MIRILLHIVFLLLLFTIQVSFIHALPYPFDRIPFVLVVTIYLYQYQNQTSSWWWLVCYGIVLDVLSISHAPLEVFSYTLLTGTMMLLVAHVFTNRSFYGMAATSILCLTVLTVSEVSIRALSHVFTSAPFLWRSVLTVNLWAVFFACLLLLFVFPPLRRIQVWVKQLFLDRI
ncbi:hypothetical protein EPN81_00320 [Patescibacteria group bacterium]|nr:MAG: hypothetical protein EPN81_00320 [Patescibacteria group bacterium]